MYNVWRKGILYSWKWKKSGKRRPVGNTINNNAIGLSHITGMQLLKMLVKIFSTRHSWWFGSIPMPFFNVPISLNLIANKSFNRYTIYQIGILKYELSVLVSLEIRGISLPSDISWWFIAPGSYYEKPGNMQSQLLQHTRPWAISLDLIRICHHRAMVCIYHTIMM